MEESGIDPKDPIFDIALGRRKPTTVRLKGGALKRARKGSEEVDKAVYDMDSVGALSGFADARKGPEIEGGRSLSASRLCFISQRIACKILLNDFAQFICEEHWPK